MAELISGPPVGGSIKIETKDIDLGNQCSRWRETLLDITAGNPSLRRYLSPPPNFLGQEKDHFHVVLAEVVAFAVCKRVLTGNVQGDPE